MLMLEYNSPTESPKNPKNEGLTLNCTEREYRFYRILSEVKGEIKVRTA
jgi:hypothetical protein